MKDVAHDHHICDATAAVIAKAEGLWQSMPVAARVVQPCVTATVSAPR